MSNETFDPQQASGESAMRGNRPLELNEVSLNGDGSAKEVSPGKWKRTGGYFRKRIIIGAPKDTKPEEVNLGEQIDVVFLKVRRRLVERGKDGKILRSTAEHNHPNDAVTLYETETKERFNGVAADLRKTFEGLRTVQVVYALLLGESKHPELVRFIVKGASLGSEVKAPEVPNFYGYISSFTNDDHFYQFKTVLTPVLEEGKQAYYAINFQRGAKLDEKQYNYALERMREVHENCTEVDTQRATRITKSSTTEPADEEVDDTLPPHMKDDINPDDIPF